MDYKVAKLTKELVIPSNRRAKAISITPKGRNVMNAIDTMYGAFGMEGR